MLAIASGTVTHAQGRQTGTVRGTVRDVQGLALPGVVVTVQSPALQGQRTARSGLRGGYEIPGLPPGVYTISFTMNGFTEVAEQAVVPLGGTALANVALEAATVSETVQVVAVVPSAIASTEISANITADNVDSLPIGRDIFKISELAQGVTNNASSAEQLTINGGFGYDNVFLIDGVDVNDNIFGTAHDLFIEDAIEETQVLTSGISAEYGRFTGGVVNTITKSGGNQFSGSFRTNLYKPNWTALTPFEKAAGQDGRSGKLSDNTTYETTLGGPLVLDRLWFFYANRVERVADDQTFGVTGLGYARTTNNDRNQLKLTGTVAPGHVLEGSYMRNSTAQGRPSFGFSIDPAATINRTLPNHLWVATYRGAMSSRLFTELQMSRKKLGFRGNGGALTDIVESPFVTLTQRLAHYNAPYFDAADPQDRDNRQVTGSATYYLDTSNSGTHSVKGGFEHFRSTLRGGNSQSATGFVFDADYAIGADGTPLLDPDGRIEPVFVPGANLLEDWRPVRGATLDIDTVSVYVNDSWTVGSHLSFNLGIRAEKVDSRATGDISGIDTSAVVPRLAAAYDPAGDGRLTIQTTYGHYAGKYSEAQFSQNTNVGAPDLLLGVYTGPAGQGRDFAPGFDPANYMTVFGLFPNQNVIFGDGLSSPLTKELTVSLGTTLGSRGYTKVSYIRRTTSDVVEDFFTIDGGATTVVGEGQTFGTFENRVFRNTDALQRSYDALQFQGRMQVTDDFLIDGSWTMQLRNEGNFEGEATNQPAISSPAFDYPEITPAARYYPTGRLDEFQEHKMRVWGIYSLGLGGAGAVDVAGIWRYDSGQVYSIAATRQGLSATQAATLSSLGYASAPDPRTLYFSDGRGSGTFKGYGLLDLSLQYSIPIWQSLNPWVKAEVYNLMNNDTAIRWDTSVVPDPNSPLDELGLATGYLEGPSFGEPTSPNDYPQWQPGRNGLRSFQLAMGFRF